MYKFLTLTVVALTLSNNATAQTDADDEMRSPTSNVLARITGKAPEQNDAAEAVEL